MKAVTPLRSEVVTFTVQSVPTENTSEELKLAWNIFPVYPVCISAINPTAHVDALLPLT